MRFTARSFRPTLPGAARLAAILAAAAAVSGAPREPGFLAGVKPAEPRTLPRLDLRLDDAGVNLADVFARVGVAS